MVEAFDFKCHGTDRLLSHLVGPRWTLFVWLALGAVLVGAALNLLTWYVARSGPEGSGGAPWSLRGNGALIVPLGLGPAVLAGIWTALVLHARGARRWRALGTGATLAGAGVEIGGVLVLAAFGNTSAGQMAANWLSVSVFPWMLLAPLLAAVVPVSRQPRGGLGWAGHLAAGCLVTVLLVVGFMGATRVLPPGS
jgi:hypothetical protein